MTAYRLDVPALYRYIDQRRQREGLSWRGVAGETGVPVSLFSKLAKDGGKPSADALMALLVWLGRDRDLRPFLDYNTEADPAT